MRILSNNPEEADIHQRRVERRKSIGLARELGETRLRLLAAAGSQRPQRTARESSGRTAASGNARAGIHWRTPRAPIQNRMKLHNMDIDEDHRVGSRR